jgi:hypothetical protein
VSATARSRRASSGRFWDVYALLGSELEAGFPPLTTSTLEKLIPRILIGVPHFRIDIVVSWEVVNFNELHNVGIILNRCYPQ